MTVPDKVWSIVKFCVTEIEAVHLSDFVALRSNEIVCVTLMVEDSVIEVVFCKLRERE